MISKTKILIACMLMATIMGAEANEDKDYLLKAGLSYNYLGDSDPNTGDYKGSARTLGIYYRFFSIKDFSIFGGITYNYINLNHAVDHLGMITYDTDLSIKYNIKSFSFYPILGYSNLLYNHEKNSSPIFGLGGSLKFGERYEISLEYKKYNLNKDIGDDNSIVQNGVYFLIGF